MSYTANRSSLTQYVSHFGVLAGAGALVLYGLSHRSKKGMALAAAGGLVAYHQVRSQSQRARSTAAAVFRINSSSAEAYRLWRNFENLPRFAAHLEEVRVLDERRSEWTARGPLNSRVRWTAEITEDQPGRRISWRSIPGSQLETSGSVAFEDDPQGRGCTVRAEVNYTKPLGPIGRELLAALGKDPNFVVKEDLRRFKALLEAGETPTTVGQTHGPRGLHGHVEQVLFRETSNHPLPQAARVPQQRIAA